MKKIIFLMFLIASCKMFCQEVKSLYAADIGIIIEENKLNNPRLKPTFSKIRIDKNINKPLNGLYKIITDKNSYYLIYYKNGKEENVYPTIVKYYEDDRLIGLDLKGRLNEGSLYTSIPEYNCKSNTLKVLRKDYDTNEIVEERKIHQKVSKRYIYWKIYNSDGFYIGKLRYDKGYIGCE